MKRKRLVVFVLLLCFGSMLFTACSKKEMNAASQAPSQSGTDITIEEAQKEAEEVVSQAKLALNSSEELYIYAFPYMASAYQSDVLNMDAEEYFQKFAKLMQEDKTIIPKDEKIIEAMQALGMSAEEGTFSLENFSAAMSSEIMQVPQQMLELIRNYNSEVNDDNYLGMAFEAYSKLNH